MMRLHQGDRFRSNITGNVYEVKKIVNDMVVLECLNKMSQILTEPDNLTLFYERQPTKDEGREADHNPDCLDTPAAKSS